MSDSSSPHHYNHCQLLQPVLLLLLLTETKAGRDEDPSESAPRHEAVWNVLGRVAREPSAVEV